jgi:hypothetical protein
MWLILLEGKWSFQKSTIGHEINYVCLICLDIMITLKYKVVCFQRRAGFKLWLLKVTYTLP